jgi:hypothetical protein
LSDIVGAVDDRIGHGLAHPDSGDLGDDVVEAFEMLDVERSETVAGDDVQHPDARGKDRETRMNFREWPDRRRHMNFI